MMVLVASADFTPFQNAVLMVVARLAAVSGQYNEFLLTSGQRQLPPGQQVFWFGQASPQALVDLREYMWYPPPLAETVFIRIRLPPVQLTDGADLEASELDDGEEVDPEVVERRVVEFLASGSDARTLAPKGARSIERRSADVIGCSQMMNCA